MTEKLCFSLEDAAAILSVGKSHLKKFTDTGELRSFRLGRRRLVSREAIEEFLRDIEQKGFIETPRGEQS